MHRACSSTGRRRRSTRRRARRILAANDEYARGALRVLAVARRELPPRPEVTTAEWVERELTFLGLVAMMDPPRPEVAAAVVTCRRAGIRITMVTGDYGLTAESIARRVGIVGEGARIVTGQDLDAHDRRGARGGPAGGGDLRARGAGAQAARGDGAAGARRGRRRHRATG